jgi:hypothetical protein
MSKPKPVRDRLDRHRIYKDPSQPNLWWALTPIDDATGAWRGTYAEAAEWMRTHLTLKAAFAEGVAL